MRESAEVEQDGFPTQKQALVFVVERWPQHATTPWRAAKVCEEAGEVMGAVIKREEGRKSDADVRQEAAQATLALMSLAEADGFDLWAAVAEEYRRATTCDHCGATLHQEACVVCTL